MTYDEIINKNKDMLPSDYKWWATHAFHFTALDNAISILKSGVLYSRIKANQNALMNIPNFSSIVFGKRHCFNSHAPQGRDTRTGKRRKSLYGFNSRTP